MSSPLSAGRQAASTGGRPVGRRPLPGRRNPVATAPGSDKSAHRSLIVNRQLKIGNRQSPPPLRGSQRRSLREFYSPPALFAAEPVGFVAAPS